VIGRVGLSLIAHELLERTRDRWVLVVSVLFALLASGASLYGQSAGAAADALTGPSLVTLVSLLVPLVGGILGHDAIVGERERNTLGLLLSLPVTRAEVVLAKYLGRLAALAGAVFFGLGAAAVVGGGGQLTVLVSLFWPTLLLGATFLSIGVLISSITARQVTAASTVVALWFGFVFFYDLGLLALLVATDGAVSQEVIAQLVYANPAGLFRIEMMAHFAGPEVLEGLGMTVGLPSAWASVCIWGAWTIAPVALSVVALNRSGRSR
jgi:Cu-processing system permease protein